ncbi:hypothetical protein [Knoellia aerolata]|uniref:ParB/Sulfiredoxin domain-containing protein n=1 Tax=Knoellia aerolata DSM 18566 TaxID=1385519 RepID=A0A0A0K0K2_9MICO|nr:hypothetical protein [Knoellia aerolata]KGN41867.1 hypothetical protein N801_04075 [Knoellia aerolata DSM 18566]
MGDITLPLSKLLLDEQNPRHRAVTNQDAALKEMIRRGPSKMLALAKDIAANGLSPIDRLIVVKSDDGKKYVVLEGNRRLTALRLLNKPQLCSDVTMRPRFEAAANDATHTPKRVRCFEVSSRDEARPLRDRRHGGEMDGVGVVRWSAMQRTRNATSPGHQERVALVTLDWLDAKSEAGANQHLADLLEEVAESKFTTFGRLAGDPDFRVYCGFDIKGDVFTPTDSSERVLARLSLVLEDFRSERSLTVTELKRKGDRERYINELRTRTAGADEVDADPDDDLDTNEDPVDEGTGLEESGDENDDADSDSGAEDEADSEPDPKPPPMKLFLGAKLNHGSTRLRHILNEVQKIPLNRYPNSAAALIRMVIELAVMEAHDVCQWPLPPERDPKLRAYVNNALRQLDPTMKAARYLDLRQQLNQRDSLINTVTLNAFLHSSTYQPSAPNMRTISDTYSVLLTDLNRAIGEAKGDA